MSTELFPQTDFILKINFTIIFDKYILPVLVILIIESILRLIVVYV